MTALRRPIRTFAAMFLTAKMTHPVMDSVADGIMWLWPFSTRFFGLDTVPAMQRHWALAFLLRWSFLAERAIIAAALGLLIRKPA